MRLSLIVALEAFFALLYGSMLFGYLKIRSIFSYKKLVHSPLYCKNSIQAYADSRTSLIAQAKLAFGFEARVSYECSKFPYCVPILTALFLLR